MYSIEDHFPVYSVFLLILIISGNNLLDLFSCRIRYLFNHSIFLNHLIAYLTLIFFIVITIPVREKHIMKIIPRSTVLYLFFLGLIKTAFPYFVSILAIILVIYVLVLYKAELQDEIDTLRVKMMTLDPALANNDKATEIVLAKQKKDALESTEQDTQEIKDFQTKIGQIVFANNALFIAMVPLYIIGFILYLLSKMKKYKKNFSFFAFFFGKIMCKAKRRHKLFSS
jgi:hypothetical protein